jgi:NRAMP (natural resistance-associated macrophage protein)-like metal ion transporter
VALFIARISRSLSDVSLPGTPDPPHVVKQPTRPRLRDVLGPGLITGASDDDPSGIATYSQVGAQFGYQLGWLMVFSWPLMCAIQEISARIGRVTGRGIAGVLKLHSSAPVLYTIVLSVLAANVINLGADLGAMAAALKLLVGGPALLYVAVFAAVSVLLETFIRYSRYVSVLKWLTVALFAYVGVVFIVHVPWPTVLHSLVVPTLSADSRTLTAVVAILGTTISPYLFFWQAEEEVEDEKERPGARPLARAPEQADAEFGRIRLDTYIGMGLSNAVALFIIITVAATLHANGTTDIETSAQAAEALRPIAGPFAFFVFALGIIGTGLLALPVLSASAAFAVGEAFGWHVGLARKPGRAKRFYGVIAAVTLAGAVLNFMPIDPIRALFWSAVINGVVAAPVMFMLMRLAGAESVMGQFAIRGMLRTVGWLATAVMTAAAVGLFATL